MEQILTASSQQPNNNFIPPIISPAFASDMGNGHFTAQLANAITNGMSIFRITAYTSSDAEALTHRNRTYTAMAVGNGIGNMESASMTVANNRISPPQTGMEFQTVVQGFWLVLAMLCGSQTMLATVYRREVVDRIHSIINAIETYYGRQAGRQAGRAQPCLPPVHDVDLPRHQCPPQVGVVPRTPNTSRLGCTHRPTLL